MQTRLLYGLSRAYQERPAGQIGRHTNTHVTSFALRYKICSAELQRHRSMSISNFYECSSSKTGVLLRPLPGIWVRAHKIRG